MIEAGTRPSLRSINEISGITDIGLAMLQVFQETQFSVSSHKKLSVIMSNIYDKALELGEEEAFAFKFTKLINKILPLKRGEKGGDRIVKFCSVFIGELYKFQTEYENNGDEDVDMARDEAFERLNYKATFFANSLVNHLLRGTEAKDRNVRYRVAQLFAYFTGMLGNLETSSYQTLVYLLKKRLNDKEAAVRLQAVLSLARFQYHAPTDEPAEDFEKDLEGITETEEKNPEESERRRFLKMNTLELLTALDTDDSPEVRRAALLNIEKGQYTMSRLIRRARDINPINRRIVYSRLLKDVEDFDLIDPKDRILLVSWGLNDREDSVQKAAIDLFNNHWFALANKDFVEFIELFDLTVDTSDLDKLLKKLFEINLDLVRNLEWDKKFWTNLSVARSILLRNIFEFLNERNYHQLISDKFIDLIVLSEILQKYLTYRNKTLKSSQPLVLKYNEYQDILRGSKRNIAEVQAHINEKNVLLQADLEKYDHLRDDQEEAGPKGKRKNRKKADKGSPLALLLSIESHEKKIALLEQDKHALRNDIRQIHENNAEVIEDYDALEDTITDLETLLQNIFTIAQSYDYADEIGRRTMMNIVRNCLTNDKLPEKLCELAMKVLQKVSLNQKDFISMATESITDIRDSAFDEHEETFHSAHAGFSDESDDDNDVDEENEDFNEDYTNNLNRIDDVFDTVIHESPNETKSSGGHTSKRRKIDYSKPPPDIVHQCLVLTEQLLKLVDGPLDSNYSLVSILQSLVIPAIVNNNDTRDLGIKCLGLFMLLDKELATEHLKIVARFFEEVKDESLKIVPIKILIDVISTYGIDILADGESNDEDSFTALKAAQLFIRVLSDHTMLQLQTVTAEGLCKLFLAGIMDNLVNMLSDEADKVNLLEILVSSYFDPINYLNNELRQTLSFCLPVYFFSHQKHQLRVCEMTGQLIYRFLKDKETFERRYENEPKALSVSNSISLASVIQQLVHWGDPNNLVKKEEEDTKTIEGPVLQIVSMLQAIESDKVSKMHKRTIINNLNKVTLNSSLKYNVLNRLKEALDETKAELEYNDDPQFQIDALTLRIFNKFHEQVNELKEKAYIIEKEQLEAVQEQSEDPADEVKEEEVAEETAGNGEEKSGEVEADDIDAHSSKVRDAGFVAEADGLDVDMGNAENNEELSEDEDENESDLDKEEEESHMSNVNEVNVSQNELDDIDEFLDAEDKVEYDL